MKEYFIRYQLLLVVMFFAIFTLAFTRANSDTTNNSSRFMTMQAIVEQGTLVVNDYHFNTDDKILREGNFYSSKPPVLSLVGAGIYYVLHNVFEANIYIPGYSSAIYAINLILVGGTYFLLLFILYQTIKLLDIPTKYRTLLLTVFAVGTLFFTYSISLNNHTIAGSILFLGFYFLLKLRLKKSDKYKKYISLAGFFLSLAAVIDLPTGLLFLFLFFIYCLIAFPKKYIIYYCLAALPMLLLHLAFNYQVTGDFLPPQLHLELWDPRGVAYGTNSRAHPAIYLVNILFGTHGLFLYTPILLFAFYSIYKNIRDKAAQFRLEAWLVFIGFIVITLYYTLKVTVYTGAAFGYRWFIAITPLLYFFLLLLFTRKRSHNFSILFFVATMFSILIAMIGFISPWGMSIVNILLPGGQTHTFDCPLLANIMLILSRL